MEPRRNPVRPLRRDSDRSGASAIAVVISVVLVLVLGACGSSGGSAGGTSGASGSGGTDCEVFADTLLEPVQLSEQDGGEPAGNQGEMTFEDELEALRAVGEELPPDLAVRWDAVLEAMEVLQVDSDGDIVEAEEDLKVTLEEVTVWAAQQCSDLPPAWRCPAQAKFEAVGNAIGEDGSTGPDRKGFDDPDEVLASVSDPDGAVVVDESDAAVMWAWLDDDGMVVRAQTATLEDGQWYDGGDIECFNESAMGGDSSSEEFETIGEPVDE